MCRIVPTSENLQMIAFRKAGNSIKATAIAFNHSQNYVAKIAPSTRSETLAQRKAGMKVYWAKRHAQKEVVKAMTAEQIAACDNEIAEYRKKIAELKEKRRNLMRGVI